MKSFLHPHEEKILIYPKNDAGSTKNYGKYKQYESSLICTTILRAGSDNPVTRSTL
jgi:hypothetical protein